MKLQRKSIAAILLLMLAFNLTATALLVQADVGGTGKFLTIEIVGEGHVTATKVKSGESWDFYWAEPPMTEKVGAGTVELKAFASEGWEFSHWEGDLLGTSENPTDYKTEKLGYVVAVFEVLTYTITPSADPEGWIYPDVAQIVNHGDDMPFWFGPINADEDHVSTILVDDQPPLGGFLETYTFEDVTEDHSIHVCLDPIGTVSVPQGPGGGYNVDGDTSLTTGLVTEGGVILGSSVIDLVIEGTSIRLYVIEWGALTIPGGVMITFLLPGGIDPYITPLTIVHGDSIEAIYSDVNGDFQVDGTDVSIVANAIKFKTYDKFLDVNGDGELTEQDILVINENKGTTLTDVTGDPGGKPGHYFITTILLNDNLTFRIR